MQNVIVTVIAEESAIMLLEQGHQNSLLITENHILAYTYIHLHKIVFLENTTIKQ